MLAMLFAVTLGEDVQELIWRLGDDDPKVREQAQSALIALGQDAWDPLQEAAGAGDPEIRTRARTILERIQWPALAGLGEQRMQIEELTGAATRRLFPEARVFLLYEKPPWTPLGPRAEVRLVFPFEPDPVRVNRGEVVGLVKMRKVERVCEQDIATFEEAVFSGRLQYPAQQKKEVDYFGRE